MTRAIGGLSEIADRFDAVLVDQFGVLHDGITASDGARICLENLKTNSKLTAALTNSGKRRDANVRRLANFGFGEELFDAVISSGELVRGLVETMLARGDLPENARVAVISRDGDMQTLSGLGLELGPPSQNLPDLMLIAGAEPETNTLGSYRALLLPSAKAGVPALCANPDRWMQTREGVRFSSGQIAEVYRDLGGTVTMLGKPSAQIFRAALEALGNPHPRRTLMIGDSPEHDIAGAASMGLQTLLVTSGPQSVTDPACAPDYSIESLIW